MSVAVVPEMSLEPVGLDRIAEAMRDEAWVDMHVVEFGTCNRVRIESVNIHRDRDVIVVLQKYPEGDEVREQTYEIDAEDVRWLRSTQVALIDVQPIVPPEPTDPDDPYYSDLSLEALTIRAIVQTISARTGASTEQIRGGDRSDRKALAERQEAMWCAFELTNLSHEEITRRYFKYRSPMPLQSVRYTVEGSFRPKPDPWSIGFVKNVRDTAAKVRKEMGNVHRDEAKYGCYPKVL